MIKRRINPRQGLILIGIILAQWIENRLIWLITTIILFGILPRAKYLDSIE